MSISFEGHHEGVHVDRYPRSSAEKIFGPYMKEFVAVQEDGVRVAAEILAYDRSGELHWHPACEFEGQPGAPDPLETPNLPFPFTAPELAAFMVDGVGAMLPSVYGEWESGPDAEMLDGLGPTAGKAREALCEAYAAYRVAEQTVGKLDPDLQRRAQALQAEAIQQNAEANAFEKVFDQSVDNDERTARRARAIAATSSLKEQSAALSKEATAEHSRWRRALIRALLAPGHGNGTQSASRPARAAPETAKPADKRRRTWFAVTAPYIVSKMQAGQFATAKELYAALLAEAEEMHTPFTKGEGAHRGSLYVREIGQPVKFTTFGNRWAEIRDLAAGS